MNFGKDHRYTYCREFKTRRAEVNDESLYGKLCVSDKKITKFAAFEKSLKFTATKSGVQLVAK